MQTEDSGTGLPPKRYRENVGVTDQALNVRHYVFSNFPTQVPDWGKEGISVAKIVRGVVGSYNLCSTDVGEDSDRQKLEMSQNGNIAAHESFFRN